MKNYNSCLMMKQKNKLTDYNKIDQQRNQILILYDFLFIEAFILNLISKDIDPVRYIC